MAYPLKQLMVSAIATFLLLNSAQAANVLKMELKASKIIKTADGKTSFVAASDAGSGETVQYRALYTNTVDKPISDITVTLPIPANMQFSGDASPASAQATIDGKNYADIPLMRRVDGKIVKVPLAEYKALRWNIKWLPANKSVDVSINTTVN